MSILVVGSVALDSVKTPFGESKEVLGGSAVYFSCAASIFAPVRILGVVGTDFPRKYVALLKRRGIDTAGLQVREGKTFRWCGRYGAALKEARTVSVSLNVMDGFSPRIPFRYQDSKYIFLANIDPDTQMKTLEQVKTPVLVVCDTMNLWIETKRADLLNLLKRVDILLLNDEEARMLTGAKNLVDACNKILRLGPKAVVVKKGEHGAILATENRGFFLTPAYPTSKVVDPTGAGDSFGGGFLGHLASTENVSESNIRRAMVYGAVVASFTVEDFSLRRLMKVGGPAVRERFARIRQMVQF
ncbi:MAG: PfkB family carbohydrate kinase [Candidatus Omnitrophota bacterium]